MAGVIKATPSSGNVFADLGLKDPEERLAKAELAVRIWAVIRSRKLTQKAAAEALGIDQPNLSKLVRGELDGFSTDQMFRFLMELGQDVEIVVHKPSRPRTRGKLTVRAA